MSPLPTLCLSRPLSGCLRGPEEPIQDKTGRHSVGKAYAIPWARKASPVVGSVVARQKSWSHHPRALGAHGVSPYSGAGGMSPPRGSRRSTAAARSGNWRVLRGRGQRKVAQALQVPAIRSWAHVRAVRAQGHGAEHRKSVGDPLPHPEGARGRGRVPGRKPNGEAAPPSRWPQRAPSAWRSTGGVGKPPADRRATIPSSHRIPSGESPRIAGARGPLPLGSGRGFSSPPRRARVYGGTHTARIHAGSRSGPPAKGTRASATPTAGHEAPPVSPRRGGRGAPHRHGAPKPVTPREPSSQRCAAPRVAPAGPGKASRSTVVPAAFRASTVPAWPEWAA